MSNGIPVVVLGHCKVGFLTWSGCSQPEEVAAVEKAAIRKLWQLFNTIYDSDTVYFVCMIRNLLMLQNSFGSSILSVQLPPPLSVK